MAVAHVQGLPKGGGAWARALGYEHPASPAPHALKGRAMRRLKGNRDYGKTIAERVLAAVDDPMVEPGPRTTWLDSWTKPAPMRYRSRRWLSMWLKGDLKDIPPDLVIRYLTEMAKDVGRFGTDGAVDRFIEKILPPIISNEPPEAQ